MSPDYLSLDNIPVSFSYLRVAVLHPSVNPWDNGQTYYVELRHSVLDVSAIEIDYTHGQITESSDELKVGMGQAGLAGLFDSGWYIHGWQIPYNEEF